MDPAWFRRQFPTLARKVWLQTDSGIEALAASLYDLGVRQWGHEVLRRPGEYRASIPVRKQILVDAVAWIEMVLEPDIWPRFVAERDVSRHDEWMGSDDDVLIEAGFRIYLPLLIAGQYRTLLERNRSSLDSSNRLIAHVLETARDAFVREYRLAESFGRTIEYTPRVENWRRLRETDPARFLWQGLSEDRLKECAETMERLMGKTLFDTELADWVPAYENLYDTRSEGYQAVGLLYNALYGFTPATRPVLIRLLTVWRALYGIALGARSEAGDVGFPDVPTQLAAGLDTMHDLLGRLAANERYEDPKETIDAARTYVVSNAPRDLGLAK